MVVSRFIGCTAFTRRNTLGTVLFTASVLVGTSWAMPTQAEASRTAQISTGWDHTCSTTAKGTVRCWGYNHWGTLGTGDKMVRVTPTNAVGLRRKGAWVSADQAHSCALTRRGGVMCWGSNVVGRIGDGGLGPRPEPVGVKKLRSGVEQIDTGAAHTCALKKNGTVRCWGFNNDGEVGDGTRKVRRTPVKVIGLSAKVAAISTGEGHTCALTRSGGALCWGDNSEGQLGDGTTKSKLTPVPVVGLESGVQAISAGNDHTCALTASGGVMCWGRIPVIVVPLGEGEGSTVPVEVEGLATGVAAISAGHYYDCVVMVTGRAKCWGENDAGQLGDGTQQERPTPVNVKRLGTSVVAISSGVYHTCALTRQGTAKCWGKNGSGQLGDGTRVRRLTPVDVKG